MSTTQDTIHGTVERIIFNNQENNFVVFVLRLNSKENTTVKGSLPNIAAGQEVTLQGAWVFHKKFGKQFDAATCTTSLPTNVVGLKKYLGSGLIKGIGKVYATKMVDYFGTQVLEVIDKYPERLTEVNGIGRERASRITTAWKDQKEIANIMVFLQEKDVSPAYAAKIYKQYGQEAIAVLHENPYRIADDIWGIGFKMADTIAHNLGIAHNDPKRIQSGILFAISQHVSSGNLYIELDQLKEITGQLLEVDKDADALLLKHALHYLYEQDKIKLVSDESGHFVTLAQYYFAEKGVAQKITNHLARPSSYSFDIDAIYQQLRASSSKIQLNDDQQAGVLACLQNKITVITGGPGTGKTTMIKQLLTILDQEKRIYKLTAPTGRAAKRMSESTRRTALTIHRLLEFDFMTMGFAHNENNALKTEFLIVDEASMIDTFLMLALLKALPLHAHLILLGDIDQLPSVGAGNVLNDIITSKKAAVVRLTQIFRQAQDSMIIVNAHRINHGEFPTSQIPDAKHDYFYIKEDEPENVMAHLTKIYKQVLPRYKIAAKDAMVLVPMNRSSVGTHNLNHQLQQLLNPVTTPEHIVRAGTTYKQGDRVMQIRNNYDKHVFNGDIGVIESIDAQEGILQVNMDDRLVEYDKDELNELVHAYAITIHKSQGSEFPAIIVPLFMQHFMLLQRNLIYTAITRAQKLCIFIGQARAIAMGIKNNKTKKRKTFLTEFLTTDLVCR